ncbi:class I SAM-dependent methyltransferase [Pseudonocardia nigra]|uniref:class I SAM-dependent methyltransferase n=1 Tax=Pseudonocardia nigra TaxID=1921578 RepID=UPI0027E2BBEB|nr:class I SAM-dependent methyltransferase [Pseudonocardia nigra]
MSASSKPRRIDRGTVLRSFDAHARTYDKLVASNPGYHEHLRMSARRMGLPNRGAGLRLLDLGCGTGASTAALLDAAPEADITAVDASEEMLEQARRKSWPSTVRFVQGNAENLAMSGITGPYDGMLAAYLLRNLVHHDAALRQFLGLLRPGAPIALHEYSVRDSFRSRIVWTTVCWGVIIPVGRIRAGSADLYRYLWRSVRKFDGVGALTARMAAAGFEDLRVQTVPGWQQHIVHTFLGRRPIEPVIDTELEMAADPEAVTPPEGVEVTKPPADG